MRAVFRRQYHRLWQHWREDNQARWTCLLGYPPVRDAQLEAAR